MTLSHSLSLPLCTYSFAPISCTTVSPHEASSFLPFQHLWHGAGIVQRPPAPPAPPPRQQPPPPAPRRSPGFLSCGRPVLVLVFFRLPALLRPPGLSVGGVRSSVRCCCFGHSAGGRGGILCGGALIYIQQQELYLPLHEKGQSKQCLVHYFCTVYLSTTPFLSKHCSPRLCFHACTKKNESWLFFRRP